MAERATETTNDVVIKASPRTVGDTVLRLTQILAARGIRLFDVIDQRAEARSVGLDLRATMLVIFGNPTAGTPVMAAAPMSALDLPLKVLVWDDSGQTKVCYNAPAALAKRHHLNAELVVGLAGIDALTDALIAPPMQSATCTRTSA